MAQSAGGSEEYSQLRTEMTYRFQTLQILVGGTVAAFLSSASVAASALAYLLSVRAGQGDFCHPVGKFVSACKCIRTTH